MRVVEQVGIIGSRRGGESKQGKYCTNCCSLAPDHSGIVYSTKPGHDHRSCRKASDKRNK